VAGLGRGSTSHVEGRAEHTHDDGGAERVEYKSLNTWEAEEEEAEDLIIIGTATG
jgi:hypothetical protein